MKRRGAFITLEGIDGTGKTTHLDRLANHLRRRGFRVTATREPGGTRAGEAIRKMLLSRKSGPLAPLAELALVYAARAQHLEEVIRPALANGRIILSDRYNDASTAYQGFGRRLGAETVRAFDRVICCGIKPDLTILLDLDPRTALKRAWSRKGAGTRFEAAGLKFQERVRAGYLTVARRDPGRVKVVGANRAVLDIQMEIRRIVDQWLGRKWGTQRSKRKAGRAK